MSQRGCLPWPIGTRHDPLGREAMEKGTGIVAVARVDPASSPIPASLSTDDIHRRSVARLQ